MSEKRDCILSLRRVSKSFPGVKALDDVNIDLYENEILGICGENGAGKSTLIKVLSGIYGAQTGEMFFGGVQRHFKSPRESIQAGISVIHQELSYVNNLSVAENIFQGRLPFRHGFVDWKRLYLDAQALMDQYGIAISAKSIMGALSIAQKQLAEIIKAISINAKVVVMDEPTSSLGLDDVQKLMDIIRRVSPKGISFIFVSHRLEELFEICHRVVVMRDGKTIGEFARDNFAAMDVVSMMVGRKVSQLYPKESIPPGEVALALDGLNSHTLKDVSLQVRAGEIAGLYGMAGAGQDDILATAFGLVKRYTGTISLNGKRRSIRSPKDAIRENMAYVTAERKSDGLILVHSVRKNIALASLPGLLRRGLISYRAEKEMARHWVKALDIKTPTLDTLVNSLSGGNQQKVVMAKWFHLRPKVLLLNEPTRGVDVGAKQEIFKIVQDMCKKGMAVLMITSDMMELMSMADTIYTVHDGRITAQFKRGEATQVKLMLAAIGKAEEDVP